MTKRIDKDLWLLAIADVVAMQATCIRKKVGCVLVDSHGHILSTGFNGPPRGVEHCIDYPCPGALIPMGQGTGTCEAVHAEANALLQCRDVELIDTAIVTIEPCLGCTKLLLNTSCRRVVFSEFYEKSRPAFDLWTQVRDVANWIQIIS